MNTKLLNVIGIGVCVAAVAGIAVLTKKEVENSLYECPNCGKRFTIDFKEYMKHAHVGSAVKLTCPRCGEKNYCDGHKYETKPNMNDFTKDTYAKAKEELKGVVEKAKYEAKHCKDKQYLEGLKDRIQTMMDTYLPHIDIDSPDAWGKYFEHSAD